MKQINMKETRKTNKEKEVFIYPTKEETRGLVKYANSLSGSEIKGFWKALFFINWDIIISAIKAHKKNLYYSTYRVWYFKSKNERSIFKKKHRI